MIFFAWMIAVPLCAQRDLTKFMGIPVDGLKSEMIKKLKSKGFVNSEFGEDVLTGEFNGTQVRLHIVTNNNKVWRIMLSDVDEMSETGIRLRFNELCRQFRKNSNYWTPTDCTIADDEDIAYELAVNDKRYEAVFYQRTLTLDSVEMRSKLADRILEKYTEEELNNPSEDVQKDIYEMSLQCATELIMKKPVWFMINERSGKYYITMYYDNEYNKANGENL